MRVRSCTRLFEVVDGAVDEEFHDQRSSAAAGEERQRLEVDVLLSGGRADASFASRAERTEGCSAVRVSRVEDTARRKGAHSEGEAHEHLIVVRRF